MVQFNLSKFCDLQGHFNDFDTLTEVVMFTVIFSCIGIVITIFNAYVLVKGAIQNKTLRQKRNVFVLSLVISDLLIGIVFTPLFVIEFIQGYDKKLWEICNIRSWRVIVFTYLFSTRLLSILLISINTYIKTCKVKTKLEYTFDRKLVWISLVFVWGITFVAITLVGISNIQAGKSLGTITYVYFFVSISAILVCYGLTFSSIKRAMSRSVSNCYDEAIDFVKGILVWFILTTTPVAICGLLLVVLAHKHEIKMSYKWFEHYVYLAALFISTMDAIANPIVYIRKFKEFRQFRPDIRRNRLSIFRTTVEPSAEA